MGASEGIPQTLQHIVGATRRIRQSNISRAFLALILVSVMSRSQRMPFLASGGFRLLLRGGGGLGMPFLA